MRRTAAVVLASGALVLLVGCAQRPQAPPAAAPPGAQEDKIVIVGTDFAFSPKEVTTSAGKKTIEFQNKGSVEHDVVVDALGFDVHANPGKTATATVELKPGTYEMYCSIPGHKEAGMVGTLTVT